MFLSEPSISGGLQLIIGQNMHHNSKVFLHAPVCTVFLFGMHTSCMLYAEPGMPTVTATVSRDTAVIIKLTPAQSYDLIEQCLVSVLPTTGSTAGRATEAVVDVSSNVLFIDGLLPGTEYSYRVAAMNEAGRSNFTEWARFTTTAIG